MAVPRAAAAREMAIPATMRAIAIDQFGPPDVLRLHTVPVPEIGPHEVLIMLHAAGVGVWDKDIRQGWWPSGRPKFPLILGTDGAGIVAARGAQVRRFRTGDQVWAYEFVNKKGGFYAEYAAVDAGHVGRMPKSLDLLQAGAAAVTGLTALQGIDNQLGLRRKETILIFGASGAVGTLAVQFAKRKQARILGTATGRDAMALVRKLGAADVIDVRRDGAIEQLQKLVPDGIDAVLVLAGGTALERCIDFVREGGRVAYPNGVESKPRRRRGIELLSYDAVAGPQEFARLNSAVEEARLIVPIAAAYPLVQAAKAHARIEKGQILGRIVLKIR
jgi:NADPH:quinone reductase